MKRVVLAFLCLLVAASAFAAPAITKNGIVNAASAAPVGLPNSAIAQGSIFSIYGTDLGPAASPALSFPLKASEGLGGVTVQIQPAGGGAVQYAIMLFVSPGQINAILPSTVPVGQATATVTYNGATSAGETFTVAKSSFGIFAVNSGGSGPGVVTNFESGSSMPLNTIAEAAAPGQIAVLWGTGLGPVTGDERQPPAQGDLGMSAELWVGGQKVPTQYQGRSTSAGEDQINFTVPDIPGCYVPVFVKIGDVVSNTTSMAISRSGKMCSDSLTFSGLDPNNVKTHGLREGYLSLNKVTTHLGLGAGSVDSVDDRVSGLFQKWPWARLMMNRGQFGVSISGACTVLAFRGDQPPTTDVVTPDWLDAGVLTLTAPGGTITLDQISKGVYSNLGTSVSLTKGAYSMTGSGGADVGPFTATLNVPDPLTWTNADATTQVNRSAGLPITWTGGVGVVMIAGYSGIDTPQQAGAMFLCMEDAGKGSFTVPSAVLLALPPSDLGVLEIGNIPASSSFNASGLDVGTFSVVFATVKSGPYL